MRNDIQPSEGEDLVMEHTKTAWSGDFFIAPDFGGGGWKRYQQKHRKLFEWYFWEVFEKRHFVIV